MGKRCPKINKDPDDVVSAFIDKYITTVKPPVTPENENNIKLMDNLHKHTTLTTVTETNLAVLVFLNHLQ